MTKFIIGANLAAKIKFAAEGGASARRICEHYRIPGSELPRVQTWIDKYAPPPPPPPPQKFAPKTKGDHHATG